MKTLRFGLACALITFLAACGGGGGGSSNPPPPPPTPAPSNLSYPVPPAFTAGTAIAVMSPMVTGSPTGYSIAPALPAGLAINTSTGAISGTPTALRAAANYLVTASNAGGSTSTSISITVNDVAPQLSYPGTSHVFTTSAPVLPLDPVVAGGTVVSWQIDHALPAGLVFDNGRISGVPTAVSAPATYLVTASNSGGSDTFSLIISVRSGVLLELGHVAQVVDIQFSGTRMMSRDGSGRVVLWDAQSGEIIFTTQAPTCTPGGSSCAEVAELAGQTLAVNRKTAFDLYSSVDGAFISRVPQLPDPEEGEPGFLFAPKWSLATDGSYLVNYRANGLAVWARAGASILSRTGNFQDSFIFAAASELRIAGGAVGPSILETIAMPSGATASTHAFIGNAAAWFQDGNRFISIAGATLLVYASDATLDDTSHPAVLTGVGGQGNYFWTKAGALDVYAVGASSNPVAHYVLGAIVEVHESGSTLGLLEYGVPSLSVIDLAGATPVRHDYPTPTYYNTAFGARSATDWAFGNHQGAMFGELTAANPQRFALGAVRSIAAGGSRVAVSTASGDILYFNAADHSLEGEIPINSAELALSADGSILFAAADDLEFQYAPDRTLRAYSLPSETVIAEWPATFGINSPTPIDFEISDAGDKIGQVIRTYDGARFQMTRRVFELDDTTLFSENFSMTDVPDDVPVRLSGSGSRIGAPYGNRDSLTASNLFDVSTLTGFVNGWAAGWIDESHLLVNEYRSENSYRRCVVVDTAGHEVSTPSFPEIRELQRIGPNTIYARNLNLIMNVLTGDTLWSSGAPPVPYGQAGAVSGQEVFFTSGTTVRVEPR